jgi:Fe-coproporphyrin III synthase
VSGVTANLREKLVVRERGLRIDHQIHSLPVLVIFPHNQCNCRCAMCDIWRIREAQEITPQDLVYQLRSLRDLGVQWVVFSGGEPQMNRQWYLLARMLRDVGIRVTLLTAGLLLEGEAERVTENMDDVIVSLDGPPAVHNAIRRVPNAYEQIATGVKALRQLRPDIVVGARCTVQKANHTSLRTTVVAAKEAELNSISFLAADVTSTAFNRPSGWSAERQDKVALTLLEVEALHTELEHLIVECRDDFDSGFIVEAPDKLRRIVEHFRAHLGLAMHVAPRCNAPWVSAVIEASGDVRPCFFHPAMGNIHNHALTEILNAPAAVRFRRELDIDSNPICRRCVCSLYMPQGGSRNPNEESRDCDIRPETVRVSEEIETSKNEVKEQVHVLEKSFQ